MLVKLQNHHYLNSDYVIDLYLQETKIEPITKKDLPKGHHIVARMIDGSFLPLMFFVEKEEAAREFHRVIEQANQK